MGPHYLVLAKLAAHREKDLDFCWELVQAGLVDTSVLRDLLPDLPWADDHLLRTHVGEWTATAASLGLSDLRNASSNRIVVRLTDHVESLGVHKYSERASFLLGHQIRAYSGAVLKNPGVSSDLLAATSM